MKTARTAHTCLLVFIICSAVQAQNGYINQNCGVDDFRCSNGKCIKASSRCDRIVNCPSGEDEQNCNCVEGEFRCVSDGSCIQDSKRCNGINNCLDGSDEANCAAPSACPPDSFTCDAGSRVQCAQHCDGNRECDGGEDEDQCNECSHECDGLCLDDANVCNGYPDCSDGSDELNCDQCDGRDDFRCNDGECINTAQYCNGIPECPDESDELYCNKTMTTKSEGCSDNEFRCRDGTCINRDFFCDNNRDCNDNSDEENCVTGCNEDQWSCPDGLCIPLISHCDGLPDCSDAADEINCPEWPTTTSRLNQVPVTTPTPTTQGPRKNPWDSGRGSDIYSQFDSSHRGPVALNLKTYPSEQIVRNAKYLNGGDVVFQCRDEGPQRAPVRWVRAGGRPMKPGFADINGRLEINKVTPADSGVYICQAVNYLGQPGSELQVTLEVEPGTATIRPAFLTCQPNEATCGSGQCIPKSAVCNGVLDCADGSDEDTCFQNGKCEPNQFKCDNNKCILKTWFCDSEDDCGDGSDERDCGSNAPGEACRPAEFACASGDQCVPKSFHCDNQQDCMDNSDELGCLPVYVTRPPQPTNVQLNVGDTLILNCSATGVPKPLISWRRNWGNVPDVCVMENFDSNGQTVGVLTCRDMQPEYNGAYSCEAMNNKGTTLAVPDAIVIVNKTSVCPSGYFNSEARSAQECIRCFCFGESTQCHSADLFTFNMPTPLGEGGTRLVGVSDPQTGQIDSQPITDQFYYQPLKNGATVTKLAPYRPSWGWSNSLPYLTLPYTYNGKQLTSYGGHIKYRLSPHSTILQDNSAPDIIIKGKHQNLMHFNHVSGSIIEARLTPENWQKSSPRGLVPATREDIMMALDDVEMILLRASISNAGVNITDFVMESAQHVNVGLGIASLVEECTCPTGYEGLSCEKCASGYARETSGAWLGNCVLERPECPQGTYGDPRSGYACRPCPCPLTNSQNQFATSCAVSPVGDVVCRCARGYQGTHCESCAPGYEGNPLVIGDSCREKPTDRCNAVGTLHRRLPDECDCKDNVQGPYCDQCKDGSFYLSDDFRHGCALCFCSGVSQQCSSSTLRRKTNLIRFNTPDIVNQVRVYDNTPPSGGLNARYNAPTETNLTATLERGEVTVSNYDRSKPTIYYWSLPVSFAGDKVTSYGGMLRYTLRHVPVPGGYSSNNAADVQIISENHLTFHYSGNFSPSPDGTLDAGVQLLEKGWQRQDGKEVSREHFLLALADVKAILVKATYTSNYQLASLVSASIETAEDTGTGPPALHVEQCVCPMGYVGTSCEDCAPGYTRIGSGLYLEHCGPCECNDHSSMCDTETGVCYNCQHNTEGDNCERCKPGYRRDNDNNCVSERAPPLTLTCDPRGTEMLYSSNTYCQCKQNVEGQNCDTCRAGTFSLDSSNPLGCYDCYCSGVTNDCHESNQFIRVPVAAPMLGDNYGGYTLMNVNGDRVLNPNIVSMPTASELMFVFNFPPNEELYWSLPVFPGNRVKSYGGSLRLKQKFESRYTSVSEPGTDVILIGESQSVFWTNPQAINVGEPLSYQVPLSEKGWSILNSATPASRSDLMAVLRNLQRVLVRATLTRDIESSSIADVSMDTATDLNDPNFPKATGVEVCMCPNGYSGTSCESCVPGFYQEGNRCQKCPCNGHGCHQDGGRRVVCDCRPPYTGADCSLRGQPGYERPNITTTLPPPPRVTVDVRITSETLKIQKVGSSVNFTCQAQSLMSRGRLPVNWFKEGGYLPQDRTVVDASRGMLIITNLQISDSGKYICQASDGVSTIQDYATLRVPGNPMTPPTVEIRPPGVKEYYEGDRVELECIANGNPSPQFSWQRAVGRALPASAQIIDNTFIIESVRQEDGGEYRCIASNQLGIVDGTAIVSVRPRPAAEPRDKLLVSQNSPTVNEGHSTRIVCTGSTNVPAGTIDWARQDGTELLSNMRSVNGVLYIDTARLENQGVYICQTSSYDVQPVLVVVTVIPQGTPAPELRSNITVPVKSLRIPQGGTGTVQCVPTGYPRPQIRWSKPQGQFGPGTSQRNNELIISNAREEDQGYYACEGTVDGNPIATIYVFVEIERREEPKIEIWPQGEQAVTLESPFELRCRVVAGIPEPDVTWSRNGGRSLSPLTQILPNNVLRFERVDVNDEGEYSCAASNVAGTASASAVIKVRSPPEVIITPSEFIEVVQGDPITVECRANGYPQPMVSIRSQLRELVAPAAGIAVLHISSASDRDDGDYVCSASSLAGNTEEPFGIRVDRGDGGYGYGGEGSGDIDVDPGFPSNPGYPQQPGYPDEQRPREQYSNEGQTTRLGCSAPAEYDVRWSRADRRSLQPNAQQSGFELIIRDASKADSGDYVCDLTDRYTGELQRSIQTRLRVMTPPRITLEPITQTVQPGESPHIECIVEGDDIEETNWRSITRPMSRRVVIRGTTLIFNRIEVEDAGKYECFARNRLGNATGSAEVIVSGPPESLVSIEQPRRMYRIGENVEVLCRIRSRDYRVTWERYGTNQFVDSKVFGDGAMLSVPNVQESDAGLYRCTGMDGFGRSSYEDFNLEVQPGSNPVYPDSEPSKLVAYTARLGDIIDMPCNHNLETPVSIEWRREYASLRPDVRPYETNLHLDRITESDAGIYVCRVSNSRTAIEVRAVLKVQGVVPQFDGNGWIALPTLKDAYKQFDIEISFKPHDANGLILYNSQNQNREGDYLALQLIDGIPHFVFDSDNEPYEVKGDRPLMLNTWHTIRISKTSNKLTMDVDNNGPSSVMSSNWQLLELAQPMYIGGVRDYDQLPTQLAGASGFIGCVSMVVLGREEFNIMVDSIDQSNVLRCDSCSPNLCYENGVCQEARNERGYVCICAPGYTGLNCDRTGEACRPELCGPGKCADTPTGYKCICPVTYTGNNCEHKQSIEYPAFTGSAYLAIKAPKASRIFRMSMKVKAAAPVSDGIIMYCAEYARGYGGFTSLTVHDGRLEFTYDLGDGSQPVVLTSNKTLSANEWTDVYIMRMGQRVSLKINKVTFEGRLVSGHDLALETPMFVGGVDDSIVLNKNTGVSGGFSGCIKDVTINDVSDIVGSSIQSANVQECSNYDRGDIPEMESACSPGQCRNGGECSADGSGCECPSGFTGQYCEARVPLTSRRPASDACAAEPCRNGGQCRRDFSTRMNYTCECPLGFAGANCQMPLELLQSVSFAGNGYLELPASMLTYENITREPVIIAIAFYAENDGVLLYQRETLAQPGRGDFLLITVDEGRVVVNWDLGGGVSTVTVDSVYVADGERHSLILKLFYDNYMLVTVDETTVRGETKGFSNIMNADSNVYVGGIPDSLNVDRYPGLNGCVAQIELMDMKHGINLGRTAVTGRNTQRCRKP